MKKFKKISALFFLGTYLLIGLIFVTPVSAADEIKFTPQIGIPGSEFTPDTGVAVGKESGAMITSDLLARYIKAFYSWGLSIIGVIAVLMLMAGGLMWLTSAGDSGKVENAKKMISGSLFGSLLLVGAYFFLNTINPDLARLPAIEMDIITKKSVEALNDAEDGIIDNKDLLPKDINIKWVCMNSSSQSCKDTNPPTLNLNVKICQEKIGNHETCGYGLIWCCGASNAIQKEIADLCKGKDDGDDCKLTMTSPNGSGYCKDNKCMSCKKIGSTCSGGLKNYECVGQSGLCGNSTDGTNDCNCGLTTCTCEKTW